MFVFAAALCRVLYRKRHLITMIFFSWEGSRELKISDEIESLNQKSFFHLTA